MSADLARLRGLITEVTEPGPLRRLGWAVFSSLIVGRTSVANAWDLVHSRHHYRLWEEDPGTISRFVRGVDEAARLMDDYEKLLPSDRKAASVVGDDARSTALPDGATRRGSRSGLLLRPMSLLSTSPGLTPSPSRGWPMWWT